MFELNKDHREALIHCLKTAKGESELNRALLDKANNREDGDKYMVGWYEVKDYLNKITLEAIEKALIENEIDY